MYTVGKKKKVMKWITKEYKGSAFLKELSLFGSEVYRYLYVKGNNNIFVKINDKGNSKL